MHRWPPQLSLFLFCVSLATFVAQGEDFRAPAGNRPANRRPGAESVLPGGRIISPLGRQFTSGPGSFGLAVSPDGKAIVSLDGGPMRRSLTILRDAGAGKWQTESIEPITIERQATDDQEWLGVFMGIAFESQDAAFVSEGNSGVVRLVDIRNGKRKRLFRLDDSNHKDSYSGELVYDSKRRLLYVVDQANFRLVIFDTNRGRLVSSVRVGRMPFALALSPDGRRAYVTHLGMFEYRPVTGADATDIRGTALPFPASGFPSPEASEGVKRQNLASETVQVPGLGDPNAVESNSVAFVNVENPAAPKVEGYVRTGLPFGGAVHGGSGPAGVLATATRVYVANAHNDSITVIDAATRQVVADIPIRVPKLEGLRGVMPTGMALHADSGWLLVAESGINAIGVIDTKTNTVLGHLPAAWFPTSIEIHNDTVYVANAKGHGTGPNAARQGQGSIQTFQANLRRGAITTFPLPGPEELAAHTRKVYGNNGFLAVKEDPAPLPEAIKHVVIIVKENRTYDEVFGDIGNASNGPTNGIWDLARFGAAGVVHSFPGLRQRFSLRNVSVTPNHHAMAQRFAFSDNFYADSEVSVDGHHWLAGSYPGPWLETTIMSGGLKNFRMNTTAPGRLRFIGSNASVHPDDQQEAGTLWHHLERHNIRFRNWGEGFELAGVAAGPGLKPTGAGVLLNTPMPEPLFRNTSREYPGFNVNIPDQYRATQFISEVEKLYVEEGKPFPQLLFLHLPNDHMAKPRMEDGYPFESSFVADNDYALGRIVEYLSKSKWWPNMAIFVTESSAQGGVDHVDSHRTVLLTVSPYARKNYVSQTHSSFPGLLKTTFRLLGLPPLNLYDAAASDLADCFTLDEPDFTPFELKSIRKEVFDPLTAHDPLDPRPQRTSQQ